MATPSYHWCYAIGAMASECDVTAIKFGITSGIGAIGHRLRTLQTGSFLPLEIIGICRRDTRQDAAGQESWLHNALSHHRLNGEWFAAVPVVERVVRRSFNNSFVPNWYDRHCWPTHGPMMEADPDFDCKCVAPDWRCA